MSGNGKTRRAQAAVAGQAVHCIVDRQTPHWRPALPPRAAATGALTGASHLAQTRGVLARVHAVVPLQILLRDLSADAQGLAL